MSYPKDIYMITHNVTKRRYIGSSNNYQWRVYCHICSLRRGDHYISDMQSDYDVFGDDYTVEVVGHIHDFKQRHKEYEVMDKYKSYIRFLGYNYNDNHVSIEKRKGVYKVYPNLKTEMQRKNIKLEDLANSIDSEPWILEQMLTVPGMVNLTAAVRIKKAINTHLTLEELFEEAK